MDVIQYCLFVLEKDARPCGANAGYCWDPVRSYRWSNTHNGAEQDHQTVPRRHGNQFVVDDDWDRRGRVRGFPSHTRHCIVWLTAQPQSHRRKPCTPPRAPMESRHRSSGNRPGSTPRSNPYGHHNSIRDGEDYRGGTCKMPHRLKV